MSAYLNHQGGGGDKCGYEDDGFNLKNLYEVIIILDS